MNTTKLSLSSLLKQTSMYAGVFVLAGLTLLPIAARAADIDIYNGLSGAGNPNVLIVLDNSANFSASAAAGTCMLTSTATGVSVTAVNSLAGTTGGIEQCALYNVIAGLPTNADDTARINIGFMVYNASGISDYAGANCGGSTGGCLVYPLQPMTTATKQNMKNWITTWQTNSSGAGSFWIKATGQATAATMQEAWAYYSGNTGLSGRSYAGIPSGCQKNFVIFIGNAYNASSSPGDSTGPAAALTTAYGATPVPSLILGTKNTTCGIYTFAPGASAHQLGGEYADEWSRYMHDKADIFSATSGQQNITTYTIGVHGAGCQASYAALLGSMADHGGGKYFATSDDNSVVQALLRILNEVQAVNSVFSSATLPVSVNTQGTYLNQIYMGMFRPDVGGNPRWIGNVKQYQFSFDANRNLFLSDAVKNPAISSAGTGFVNPSAASFWSCANSTHAATRPSPYDTLPTCALDPVPGFWANSPNYVDNTVGGAFDFQDGEVVEKGGAGQQLRLANLTNVYATTPAAPRKLYTDCPQGGCLTVDGYALTPDGYALSDHPFATTNANITAAMFGTGLNLAISGISRAVNVATATTAGSHNLAVGDTVTIVGATPNDYNGLVTITALPTSNSFSYFVQEYPPLTATTVTSGGIGGYVASEPGGTATYALSSLSRVAAGTAANAAVTAVTAAATPFANGDSVTIAGVTPTNYNLTQNIALVNSTTFTFPVAVNPPPTAVGSYRVSLANASVLTVSGFPTCTPSKVVTLQTTTSHGLRTGDQVTVSGDIQSPAAKQGNGTFAPITVLSSSSFSYQAVSCPGAAPIGAVVQGGPVSPLAVTLTRNETAVGTATVTATISSSGQFANGDLVNITAAPSTTTPANESGYLVSSKAIACATNPCGTVFSFTISTTPDTQPTGSGMTAAGAAPAQTITSLSRIGTTAMVTLDAAGAGFADQATVVIQTAPGTTQASNEGAYTGSKTITCVVGNPCTTFTYAPVTLSPVSPAGGSIYASNPGMTPDRTSLINWIRGEDNFGDEQSLCPPGSTAGTAPCPSTKVTVRPSVHGDTLHSRPIALNYGSSKGVVVYYGTNDGVYHAINGNQTAAIGSTPAGGELWGFVAKDFYGKFNRQRSNLPALALPSTPPGILPTPQPKDYFIDGPTGVYQAIDGNGDTTRAIIYIGARRGGRFIHAVDVTDPAIPKYLWRLSSSTTGFEELGQTWSQPKVARIRGYANPVLIFGAGYDDGGEDGEPPLSATDNGGGIDMGSDNIGRGIFIVDAFDGHLVWQARHYSTFEWSWYWYRYTPMGASCTGTPPAAVICDVPAMNYSIPADVTLMDKDHDGYVDRLYGADNGGNVWRLDFEPSTGNTPDNWRITQLAALGCTWGACDMQLNSTPIYANPATTQRKFFFPAEVIGAISTTNYDAVFVGSGDREHPLITNDAYYVVNRVYMIKDFYTGKTSTQTYPITETGEYFGTSMKLADCTGTTAAPNTCTAATTGAASAQRYDKLSSAQQRSGYYITLRTGEKVVNAPLTTAGYVYFGTNQPAVPDPLSCTNNLGIARGYQLRPFTAEYASTIFDGGGLPPSSVSGIVDITNPDGTVTQAPFCVGCATPLSGDAGSVNECDKSSLAGCDPNIDVSHNRKRNYWYLNNK